MTPADTKKRMQAMRGPLVVAFLALLAAPAAAQDAHLLQQRASFAFREMETARRDADHAAQEAKQIEAEAVRLQAEADKLRAQATEARKRSDAARQRETEARTRWEANTAELEKLKSPVAADPKK